MRIKIIKNVLFHLKLHRDYALDRLNNINGIRCEKPQATFVLFPDVSKIPMSAEELANYLKINEKVAVVPGGEKFFGPGSEGHIRITLATSREILEEGLNRIENGINKVLGG